MLPKLFTSLESKYLTIDDESSKDISRVTEDSFEASEHCHEIQQSYRDRPRAQFAEKRDAHKESREATSEPAEESSGVRDASSRSKSGHSSFGELDLFAKQPPAKAWKDVSAVEPIAKEDKSTSSGGTAGSISMVKHASESFVPSFESSSPGDTSTRNLIKDRRSPDCVTTNDFGCGGKTQHFRVIGSNNVNNESTSTFSSSSDSGNFTSPKRDDLQDTINRSRSTSKDASMMGSSVGPSMDAFGFPLPPPPKDTPTKSVKSVPNKVHVPSGDFGHDLDRDSAMRSVKSVPCLKRIHNDVQGKPMLPTSVDPLVVSRSLLESHDALMVRCAQVIGAQVKVGAKASPEHIVIDDDVDEIDLILGSIATKTEGKFNKTPEKVPEDGAFPAAESSIEQEVSFMVVPSPTRGRRRRHKSFSLSCTDDELYLSVPWKDVEKTWEKRVFEFMDTMEDKCFKCAYLIGCSNNRAPAYGCDIQINPGRRRRRPTKQETAGEAMNNSWSIDLTISEDRV